MNFGDILKRSIGETVVINNNEERTVLAVEEDFVVLQGGNSQMKITEFIPLAQVVKVIRADYATGGASVSVDLNISGGDQQRSGMH
ncbi:MAG TPA: hypothetical protein VK689_22670 [Armatimonadota bacterium]|jgi:hypothetical protein|nr:hypothetical protein [Armatimonadota bacterium]